MFPAGRPATSCVKILNSLTPLAAIYVTLFYCRLPFELSHVFMVSLKGKRN